MSSTGGGSQGILLAASAMAEIYTMESLDCAIIGAGWYGLAAAKQYHCTCPTDSLAVFESESTLGGTWADHRLYPGLKSNNLLGTIQYPDFHMSEGAFNVKPGEHVEGAAINHYLNAYAASFGITNKIRLETKVVSAEHQDLPSGGWILTVANSKEEESKVFARRLFIATGLTSEAFLPRIVGQEDFGGKIFHGKDFKQNSDTLKTAAAVTVFGGSKFAWDAVYEYATAGVKVNWVIRPSGHGPCWMTPPYVTPFKKWLEKLVNIRFLTWFSPCVWAEFGGYSAIRSFLHGTAIGRFIVNVFWKVLGSDVMNLNAYDSHPETAKLKPWTEPLFTGTSFSILNYKTNFFDLVKSGKIKVHISEIDHLSSGKIHLADGTELESDALLAHTGWKHVPPMKFLPEGIDRELGLPHPRVGKAPAEDLANQESLIEAVDREIFERFPRLKDQPVWNKDYVALNDPEATDSNDGKASKSLTPYMLYHFLVPPSERFLRNRDIVFIGMVSNFSHMTTAHLQGLWVSAYFSGRLANDPSKAVNNGAALEKLRYETVLHNRFGRWRYPTDWGDRAPNFVFDAVSYLDLLQRDLGLNPHRKGNFFSEIWDPYGPDDFRQINEEWEKKYARSNPAF